MLTYVSPIYAQHTEQLLDSVFQALNTDGEMSGAFLLAEKGKIVYEKYLGYEDARKQHPIDSLSRFELASVSKQFTAMAILQLVEAGKIALQDDILRYFPKLKYKEVTIEHLLRHTSGIPEFLGWGTERIDTAKRHSNIDVLKSLELKADTAHFKAGDHFSYSNTNYVLLALIVEKTAGISFANYLQKHVFEPANMNHSSVFHPYAPQADLRHFATSFDYDVTRKSFVSANNQVQNKYARYFDGVAGPYGISSTTRDLLHWHYALADNKLVSHELFQKGLTVGKLNNGDTVNMAGLYYGFGWLFKDTLANDQKMHFHTGGYSGYQTIFVREPQTERTVIALINKKNLVNIFQLTSVFNAVLTGKEIPAIAREEVGTAISLSEFQVQALVGHYVYSENPELKLTITSDHAGKIFAQLTNQQTVEIYPKSELELFYTVVKATLKFSKTENKVTKLTLFQNGAELDFIKTTTP